MTSPLKGHNLVSTLTSPDFVFSLKNQVNDAEGMGGKLSSDDKETILEAVKEKSQWLDENPEAEAEDYEDQLSELQATVGVSAFVLQRTCEPMLTPFSPLLPSSTAAVLVATMTRFLSATTSFREGRWRLEEDR